MQLGTKSHGVSNEAVIHLKAESPDNSFPKGEQGK